MAGHSKWANIKRRKGAQDAIRGKLFTKLIKEIMVAAKMGGGDLDANPRLRLAVDKAKANSMPRDNIKRAIDKATGNVDTANYEELIMEGYGPGGVAVMLEILTDNRNRTASEVRFAFTKGNGNLGTSGCVSYMFNRKGVLLVPCDTADEDSVMMTALEAGAEDISEDEGTWEILSGIDEFMAVKDALSEAGIEPSSAELRYLPDLNVDLAGPEAEQFLRLMELLEDCDDVQEVHHNADISAGELARLVGE
jgi:YebC/PmpR family DNA-binding regulatory protein